MSEETFLAFYKLGTTNYHVESLSEYKTNGDIEGWVLFAQGTSDQCDYEIAKSRHRRKFGIMAPKKLRELGVP
jgi:hypothetical protein